MFSSKDTTFSSVCVVSSFWPIIQLQWYALECASSACVYATCLYLQCTCVPDGCKRYIYIKKRRILFERRILSSRSGKQDTFFLIRSDIWSWRSFKSPFSIFILFFFWRLHHLILFHSLVYNYLWIISSKHFVRSHGLPNIRHVPIHPRRYEYDAGRWPSCSWSSLVLNLLNTTVVDFYGLQLQRCFTAQNCPVCLPAGFHSHGFYNYLRVWVFAGTPLELAR